MARLKKRYWIPLTILFFATALSLCGWGYWVSFKQQHGITVDWKNINISFDGLSFDEFTFTKQSLLMVKSKNLLVSWSTLSATNVDIDWLSNDKSPLASMNSPFLAAVVFWLPNTINIDSLRFYQQNKEWFNIKINATKQQLTSNVVIGPGQSTFDR